MARCSRKRAAPRRGRLESRRDGHDGRRRTGRRRLDHDGVARPERDTAGQREHDRTRHGGDRADRVLARTRSPERWRAGAHAVARPGDQRPGEPVLHRADRVGRAGGDARAAHAAARRHARRPRARARDRPGAGRAAGRRAAAGAVGGRGRATRCRTSRRSRCRWCSSIASPTRSLDQIGSENVEPTAQLVDHLASCGHSRIGMVVGSPQLSTTLERLAGYELGLERNGLAFEPALVVLGRVAPRRGGRGDAAACSTSTRRRPRSSAATTR